MPEPIRVEDLPESRQAELMLAAIDAGVQVRKLRYPDGDRWDALLSISIDGWRMLSEQRKNPAEAYAAAALALGLEPRVRVVDTAVADEVAAPLAPPLNVGALKRAIMRAEASASSNPEWAQEANALSALARALCGEVNEQAVSSPVS